MNSNRFSTAKPGQVLCANCPTANFSAAETLKVSFGRLLNDAKRVKRKRISCLLASKSEVPSTFTLSMILLRHIHLEKEKTKTGEQIRNLMTLTQRGSIFSLLIIAAVTLLLFGSIERSLVDGNYFPQHKD